MTTDYSAFNVDFVKKLIEFNFWENRRVWDAAIMQLTEARFTEDTGYSWGSLQRECVHIMNGERGWLQRIQGTPDQRLEFEDYIERATVRQKWNEIEQLWTAFAVQLTPEQFFGDCVFEFRGKEKSMPTSNLIFHAMNHGTLHRAEILRMVTDLGHTVDFDLSMMQYLTGVFRD